MSGPTAEELRTVLDKYSEGATWDVAMAAGGGRKGKTVFSWITKSQRAEQMKDRGSVYFMKWTDDDDDDPDALPDWFHVHLKSAGRARRTILYETILVSQALHGVVELVLDGSGKIVWQEDPRLVGMSDDMLELSGLPDRLLRDDKGLPVPQTRTTQLPATLRQQIIKSLMPGVYGDHSTINVQSTQAVHVTHAYLRRPKEPAPVAALPAPAATPAAPEKVESELVRDLRASLKAGVKNPRPNAPVEILGRATGDKPDNVSGFPADNPSTDLRDHPRAYQAPALKPATQPAPNYGRPQQTLDHAGRGKSIPPLGGFRVG